MGLYNSETKWCVCRVRSNLNELTYLSSVSDESLVKKQTLVGVRVGYKFEYDLLYVAPWIGFDKNLNQETIVLDSEEYEENHLSYS